MTKVEDISKYEEESEEKDGKHVKQEKQESAEAECKKEATPKSERCNVKKEEVEAMDTN